MQRSYLLLSAVALTCTGVLAQQSLNQPLLQFPAVDHSTLHNPTATPTMTGESVMDSTTILWSEDFSAGIPSSWTNQGYVVNLSTGNQTPDPDASWEYRGPSTSPSNTTGSRGAYSSAQPTILSPTAGNGFVIFDSDYLDTDGIQGNFGGGDAPAPHIGTLTTSSIDLSGYPAVELSMTSYARTFGSRFAVAISTNGGSSFTDTVHIHPTFTPNDISARDEKVTLNISAVAGGQSNVVLQFVFDGTVQVNTANGPAWGLYFWQIDDIAIRELRPHQLNFTEHNDAPAQSIIYPDGSPTYGNLHLRQAVPIAFSGNLYNYGTENQTNVQLMTEVVDSNGNTVASVTSPAISQLNHGDTATAQILTTSTWIPTAAGSYDIYYSAISDSIPASQAAAELAYTIEVNDQYHNANRYSYLFNGIDNYIGTNSLAYGDILSIGENFTFPNSDPDSAGYVFINSISVPFESTTDPTATIYWEVYDTAGFTYANGPSGSVLWDSIYQLDTNAPGTFHEFDFRGISGGDTAPLVLPSGAGYYFVMNMIPNDPNGVVRIGNDQTIEQQGANVIVQMFTGQWFSRFSNSSNLSSPIFIMEMGGALNTPPTTAFTATPTNGNIPLTVAFDATASTDPDGDTISYTWEFGDGNMGTGDTISNTYTTGGTYWARLTVSDGKGGTATDSVEIIAFDPNNSVPTASFTATPDSGIVPLSVSFNASASSDADNHTLSYIWDFGDGSTDTGQTTTNTYNSIGSYWATLSVDDGNGGTDIDSLEIIVSPNSPPSASLTATPDSGQAPLTVQFDASASSDANNDSLTYTWDFGDGNIGSGITPAHTYNSTGNYLAVLNVDDGNGGNDQDSVEISVVNTAPTASFILSTSSGTVPLTVNFNASGSSDPNNDSLSYSWKFGDGANGTGKITSHTYTSPGNYCPILTVDDGNGATDTDSICLQAIAPNTAPIVAFTASPDTGGAPLQVVFDASATMDPDGDTLTYSWDFGDGNTDTGITTTNIYTIDSSSTDTTYWAFLIVDDGQGARTTDSTSIYVINNIGVGEHLSNRLAVYPNPTDGEIIIAVEEGGGFTLEVLTITGRRVYSEKIELNGGEKLQKDFSHLPKGTYLIDISSQSFRDTRKLTIK